MEITKGISRQINKRIIMSKQTAVEFLEDNYLLIKKNRNEYFKQAKEMEKQQIITAWENGNHTEMRGGKYLKLTAEQYYNETFKK